MVATGKVAPRWVSRTVTRVEPPPDDVGAVHGGVGEAGAYGEGVDGLDGLDVGAYGEAWGGGKGAWNGCWEGGWNGGGGASGQSRGSVQGLEHTRTRLIHQAVPLLEGPAFVPAPRLRLPLGRRGVPQSGEDAP